MQSDLHIVVRGDLVVFRVLPIDGDKGGRVVCPKCSSIVDPGKARTHFTRIHGGEIKNGESHEETNDAQQGKIVRQSVATIPSPLQQQPEETDDTVEQSGSNTQGETANPSPTQQQSEGTDNTVEEECQISLQNRATAFRKRKQTDEDHAIWKRLCGEVPDRILTSTMASMPANAFKISGHGLILPPSTLTFLQGILPHGYSLSKIDLSKANNKPLTNDDSLSTLDVMSPTHLLAVECGGTVGLERIVGALLTTGSHQFKILCAEVYSRDRLEDPHAESHSAFPSSVPTDGVGTQYKGELKIVHIYGEFNNRKLVIGVRGHNYLVTSGLHNGKTLVGPGRCSEFPVNHATKIYFRKENQDADILEGDILGLAQVRTHFGHTATYSTRRAALRGYGSIPLMPVTVFTLSQFEVKHSRVFRELAVRSMKTKVSKVCLYSKDMDEPHTTNTTEVANITRKLMCLLSQERKLVVTGNDQAEKLLSELANAFSRTISDKNLTIARRISSSLE